jgi:hypothetical protein
MSFIADSNGKAYEPGYFLAHEECTRETRQFAQAGAVTADNGGKYVPMGTAYPANDATAIGIVYEDVDVTYGDMPGSVVTKGEVYEDKLAITSESYDAVTPETGDDPAEKGWYERSGSAGSYVYTLTTDTTVTEGKTYYKKVVTRLASAAKTALEGLGFKFITSTDVVRPY